MHIDRLCSYMTCQKHEEYGEGCTYTRHSHSFPPFIVQSPLIPGLDTLLQDLEMLRVRHRSRLPLYAYRLPIRH